MSKARRKSFTLSYRVITFLLICLIILVLFILIKDTRSQKSGNNTPIQNPPKLVTKAQEHQPTIGPTKEGFHGYVISKPWFNLNLPPECNIETNRFITCKTPKFLVFIHPEASGRDAIIKEKEEIQIGDHLWERKIIETNHEEFGVSTYNLLKGVSAEDRKYLSGNNYLIEVRLEPYTSESQKYFETILSSFHFIK